MQSHMRGNKYPAPPIFRPKRLVVGVLNPFYKNKPIVGFIIRLCFHGFFVIAPLKKLMDVVKGGVGGNRS
jgi:hypothetical protein